MVGASYLGAPPIIEQQLDKARALLAGMRKAWPSSQNVYRTADLKKIIALAQALRQTFYDAVASGAQASESITDNEELLGRVNRALAEAKGYDRTLASVAKLAASADEQVTAEGLRTHIPGLVDTLLDHWASLMPLYDVSADWFTETQGAQTLAAVRELSFYVAETMQKITKRRRKLAGAALAVGGVALAGGGVYMLIRRSRRAGALPPVPMEGVQRLKAAGQHLALVAFVNPDGEEHHAADE